MGKGGDSQVQMNLLLKDQLKNLDPHLAQWVKHTLEGITTLLQVTNII